MGISETAKYLFSKICIETIKHVYIDCENVRSLWKATEDWVRLIHGYHFKIGFWR